MLEMNELEIVFQERLNAFKEKIICNETILSSSVELCQQLNNGGHLCDPYIQLFFVYAVQNLEIFRTLVISLASINAVLMLCATLGNGLIIISILKSPNLMKPSYILITSLALSDLLVGLVFHPMYIRGCYILLNHSNGDLFCRVLMLSELGSIPLAFVSVLISLLISIDRYLALTRRQHYRQIVSKRKTIFSVVAACCISLVVTFALLYTKRIDNFFYRGCIGIGCVIITCIFYVLSFKSLHRYTAQIQPQQNGQPQGTFDLKKYRKTLKTMLIILISLVVCYTPFLLSPFLIILGTFNIDFYIVFFNLSATIFALNSSVNPFIYLIRFTEVRQSCRQILRI